MSTLHDDLTSLTATQPVQPPNRLTAVTRKAGRIRRFRTAVTVAAVLAVAAPVSVVVLRPAPDVSHTAYSGRPVSTWPDRSNPTHTSIGTGALAFWADFQHGDTSQVHWLYRDVITHVAFEDTYLAIWSTPTTVVVARGVVQQLDRNGYSAKDAGRPGGWDVLEVPAGKVKGIIGLYLSSLPDAEVVDSSLFALTDPATRLLDWTSAPVPYAPSGATHGSMTSPNGVFHGDVGGLTGPVTVRLNDSRHVLGAPVDFGFGSRHADLVNPAVPDLPPGFQLEQGGTGEVDRGADGTFTIAQYSAGPTSSGKRAFVRCYGGGVLTVTLNDKPQHGVLCDNRTHEVFDAKQASISGDPVGLSSSRQVIYNFVWASLPSSR